VLDIVSQVDHRHPALTELALDDVPVGERSLDLFELGRELWHADIEGGGRTILLLYDTHYRGGEPVKTVMCGE
jgi:hypothetical protein